MLAAPVPPGAKLTALMDCCHSGTALDLPFVYSAGKVVCGAGAANKQTAGEVILFSSCLDDQTAADSKNLSRVAFSGVLTFSFCKSILVLLHVLAGPIESLLCPLHVIIHHYCYLE